MFYLLYSLPMVFPQWAFNLEGPGPRGDLGDPERLLMTHLDEVLTDHLFKGCKRRWTEKSGWKGGDLQRKTEINLR